MRLLVALSLVLGCGPLVLVDDETPPNEPDSTSSSSSPNPVNNSVDASASNTSSGEGGFGGVTVTTSTGSGGSSSSVEPCLDEGLAIAEFGMCMSFMDWQAAGLSSVNLPSSSASGACGGCHAPADFGFGSGDAKSVFLAHTVTPHILKIAEPVLSGACVVDFTYANGYASPSFEHPAYALSPEMVVGLETFFDLTYAHWVSGMCPGP